MGSMGPGTFDSDAALDILDEVMEIPLEGLESSLESDDVVIEHIDPVAACVAIRIALVRGCDAAPPSVRTAARLREKVLHVFDEHFDTLRPKPGHKQARRADLELRGSYARLADQARRD